MQKTVLVVILLLVVVGFLGWRLMKNNPPASNVSQTVVASSNPFVASVSPRPTPNPNSLADSIADFKPRITKKFFGTYVTPQNSPVQPERFTGFHTGVDVEYGDVTSDVPVFAISDGKIVTAEYASGYGGVMVLQFQYNNQTLYAIYGHLRQSSMVKTGAQVKKGQQLAVLGTAYSQETDGERRHLHFGIAKQNTILGYTQTKAALSPWLDPLSLYP